MDCWNELKIYFEVGGPGEAEKEQVCETLENKNRVNLQLEQSTVRIRLCDELRNGVTASECADLEAMVQAMGETYPDLACSAYGFGVGDATIEGCEGLTAATPPPTLEGTPDETTDHSTEPPEGGTSSSAPVIHSFMISTLFFGWSMTVSGWF